MGHALSAAAPRGRRKALREPGPLVASKTAVSKRRVFRELLSATGGFAIGGLTEVRVTESPLRGILPPPRSAHVAGDGRALAWFGDGRACVVHPTLADLCSVHGVEVEATLAA